MDTIVFGENELQSSSLALGTWQWYDRYWNDELPSPTVAVNRAKGLVQTALNEGITHFDSALVYGNGCSDQVLGQTLKVHPNLLYATKSIYQPPSVLKKKIELTLRRTNRDYIDLFYIHWPKTGVDMRPSFEWLQSMKEQGIIRAIGVSNFSLSQLKEAVSVARIDACQVGHHLLWRFPEEDILPFCVEHLIQPVLYSPLAQGILTGKFFNSNEVSLPRGIRGSLVFFKEPVLSRAKTFVEELTVLARGENLTLSQLVLSWSLSLECRPIVVFGATDKAQLKENCGVVSLPQAVVSEIDRLSKPFLSLLQKDTNPFYHHT